MPSLKPLDGAAKILAHILQLACAEDEHNDGKDDQPVPNGKRTHFSPEISSSTGGDRQGRGCADEELPDRRRGRY